MPPITAPITFNLMSNANKQPGTYRSNVATIPEGVGEIRVRDTMSDADASDVSKSFEIRMFVAPAGVPVPAAGVNPQTVGWGLAHSIQWQGGTEPDKQGNTIVNHCDVGFTLTPLLDGTWNGWTVFADLVLPVQLRTGIDVTVFPKV